jgi:uncharacterized iron-regulated protein
VYSKNGKRSTFKKLEKASLEKEFVFFGELHNNPIAHWLQLELLKSLHQKHDSSLVIGAEMFEADNQQGINDYLAGKIDEKNIKDHVRLWTNFVTDYKPLLDYAKEKKLSFIATNIPRRYASSVFKKGIQSLDTLREMEKAWMCPLPFQIDTTLSQYAALLDGEMHMGPNFVKAQAIKDATMGYFISKNWKPGKVFYHVNGSYHSDFHQGILWYVQKYLSVKASQFLTISVVEQDDLSKLESEYLGKADFIICVPTTMTKTH